ncbi:helix-turn-helix domain-containing protein [Corynebacterium uterequi]|uniref:Helix-turn-helix protein n=1 Tax=Corynebacterium uterequi TaxID=1072256 RepID=A0A0G3HK38_9CORY|nr:helix-turn-helix transcriptional regulator [Corynebacterium uterequi]AKK11517.1 Helix-turn-helix protein [Corynebacterium uterequi]
MSRASRTPPRQRYHGWPNNRVGDPIYERLRLFVAGLDEFITAEIDAGRVVSRRAFAEAAGLPHSTLTKLINGDAVPDGLTIAALEVACGKSLWPSHHRAESSLKGE